MALRYREGFRDLPTQVPCGQCLGCRLDWAGDWAARCEKEAKLHSHNSFVTLTYDDDHQPIGGSSRGTVSKRDFQLFMKRLRKARFGNAKGEFRYFASGEYGDKTERPHYHALLFGCDFPDRELFSGRAKLYVSAELQRIWGEGFCTVQAVNFATASYVARYVLKKVTVENHPDFTDRAEPFILMSRRPGIGSDWYDKYKADVYPAGHLVVGEGKMRRVPRYFDEKYKLENPAGYLTLKIKRRAHALSNADPTLNPSQQLYAKQETLKSKTSLLIRPL